MRALHAAFAVILSGCAALTGISSDYPQGWPKLDLQAAECPNLTGRYLDEATYSYLPSPSANRLLYRLSGERVREVSLRSLPRQLLIEGETADGKVYRSTLSEDGDFACVDGSIALKPIVQSAAEGVGGYRSERRLLLRRSANGDLIGEDRLFSIGAVMWLVPIAGSQKFWYRWQKHEG
jgi:hypothetical protein